jgi:hypothetical protein
VLPILLVLVHELLVAEAAVVVVAAAGPRRVPPRRAVPLLLPLRRGTGSAPRGAAGVSAVGLGGGRVVVGGVLGARPLVQLLRLLPQLKSRSSGAKDLCG